MRDSVVEFTTDEIVLTCGGTCWTVGSDLDLCQRILEHPRRYWYCPVLYADEPEALAFPPHKALLILAVADETIEGVNTTERFLAFFDPDDTF
jgi:hypothetical protein